MLEVEGGAGKRPWRGRNLCFHTYGEFSSSSSSLRLGINLEAKSWVDFRPEGQISGLKGPGGNELTVRRTDGQMDGQNDEQKSPCVLQDFIPFGAAALLPLTPIHNQGKQGNGYR